jgi:hypothetical protein
MRARQADGINIQEQFGRADGNESMQRSTRPEMKGPTDISDLLSGLKTMSVSGMSPTPSDNIKMTSAPMKSAAPERTPMPVKKSTTPSANKPRKQKSDKNTVSLDI